jgi:polar amino acid transport system substrate-binding protein
MMRHLALLFSLLVLPSAADERTVLRVGMDTRSAPWCFVPGLDYSKEDQKAPPVVTRAQTRKLAGLDVDVVHAVARRMSAQVGVVPMPWADLEAGLIEKRYDLLISGWTPRVTTPDEIVASAPYLEWGLLVAVRAEDPIRSAADLEDRRVGHYDDPVVTRALAALGRGRFKTYGSVSAMFADLETGALDAVIFDSVHVRWRVAHDPSLRAVGEPLNRLGYHFGLRREDTALFARVQAAIKDLVASGEMEKIRRKWEGSTP